MSLETGQGLQQPYQKLMLIQQIMHYLKGRFLSLNRAHPLLWKPAMSDEEEISGGEEGAGELQNDDV